MAAPDTPMTDGTERAARETLDQIRGQIQADPEFGEHLNRLAIGIGFDGIIDLAEQHPDMAAMLIHDLRRNEKLRAQMDADDEARLAAGMPLEPYEGD